MVVVVSVIMKTVISVITVGVDFHGAGPESRYRPWRWFRTSLTWPTTLNILQNLPCFHRNPTVKTTDRPVSKSRLSKSQTYLNYQQRGELYQVVKNRTISGQGRKKKGKFFWKISVIAETSCLVISTCLMIMRRWLILKIEIVLHFGIESSKNARTLIYMTVRVIQCDCCFGSAYVWVWLSVILGTNIDQNTFNPGKAYDHEYITWLYIFLF